VTDRASRTAAAAPEGTLEVALAHVLQVGTYVSIGLVAIGSVLLLAGGGSPLQGAPPLSVATLAADLAAFRPAGFLWLGIVGVLATPALRVLRAGLGFYRRGERAMALVSVLVLAVIAIGVVVGVMAG
jgi:uncharacterized membrane protein